MGKDGGSEPDGESAPDVWTQFTISMLVGVIFGVVAAWLTHPSTHRFTPAVFAGVVAFGAASERTWTILRRLRGTEA